MPDARTGADALKVKWGPLFPVEVRYAHAVGTVPGVVVTAAAYRNGPGTGTMRWDPTKGLSWRAPGSATFGGAQPFAADGTGLIEDGEDRGKFLRVTVATAYLPDGAVEKPVHLADRYGNETGVADDVPVAWALAGHVMIWDLWLTNMGRSLMSNLKVWIDPAASAFFELADGLGGWIRPTTEADARLLGQLAIDAEMSLYPAARTIISPATAYSPRELNWMHFAWEGW